MEQVNIPFNQGFLILVVHSACFFTFGWGNVEFKQKNNDYTHISGLYRLVNLPCYGFRDRSTVSATP